MEDSRTYKVYPSELDVVCAFRRLRDHLIESGFKEDPGACERIEYVIKVAPTRSLTARNYDEFLRAFEHHAQALPIRIHSHWEKDNKEPLTCKITISQADIDAIVESPNPHTLSAVHERIREYFSASNPLPDRSDRLDRWSIKKSVFLAHRFDKCGSTTAATLRTFLNRLGFDIKEGEGYEAGTIPDKVSERVRSQDILICLVTPGDPSWILSEAAFAHGRGKYLVILSEEGTSFNKGIIGGDYEHLTFPKGLIEKAFCDLLYTLPT